MGQRAWGTKGRQPAGGRAHGAKTARSTAGSKVGDGASGAPISNVRGFLMLEVACGKHTPTPRDDQQLVARGVGCTRAFGPAPNMPLPCLWTLEVREGSQSGMWPRSAGWSALFALPGRRRTRSCVVWCMFGVPTGPRSRESSAASAASRSAHPRRQRACRVRCERLQGTGAWRCRGRHTSGAASQLLPVGQRPTHYSQTTSTTRAVSPPMGHPQECPQHAQGAVEQAREGLLQGARID
jgi:hypothetical protein